MDGLGSITYGLRQMWLDQNVTEYEFLLEKCTKCEEISLIKLGKYSKS